METDPDVIISSENYNKFDIGDIRRSHIEWVQDLLRQGLMTQCKFSSIEHRSGTDPN
jgi:hypothetical protein